AVVGTQMACLDLRADEAAGTINSLKQQIEQLDQKLRILERKSDLDREAASEKAKAAPIISLGAGGFQVRSADSNFAFRARGYVQVDARYYPEPVPGALLPDTFLIRRARPIFEGTVFDEFDYRVMLDFGAQATLSTANNALVQDAYVTARLWPEFQFVAGKMKEPVGLERLQSGANLLFIERGYPTQLAPNRDVGFGLQGDLVGGRLSYAAGVFNGVADGGSGDFDTSDRDKDVAARLFAHPFKTSGIDALKGLGAGVAGTYGNREGALRSYFSPGLQRTVAYRAGAGTNAATANVVGEGTHWRISPQGWYYRGPFGLFGEYIISSQEVRRDEGGLPSRARLENSAWQVAASYFLTGETNSYRAVTPRRPFSPAEGGWGAWEIAARVGQLDVDDDAFPLLANPANSATRSTSYGVGLNWHANRNIKISAGYDYTEFDADPGTTFAGESEHVVLVRVQFGW
ncbi:MAG TPA: porin, partial [Verrucomicrobiae bacterium]|nr:porin [Verrucomicrobiae bacterium]